MTDRERMIKWLSKQDPRWVKAFELLEKMAGTELSTPAIIDLEDYRTEDEPGDVAFHWDDGETGITLSLEIYFLEDDTPMVEWFWIDTASTYEGTEEDGILLTELPESAIKVLRGKKRSK